MSLKKEFSVGILFSAFSKYSGIIISLGVTSILSRLLSPEQFGVVGVATVLIAFFNILGDIGIGPAIIQRNNLTQEDLKNIHSFTTLLGIILGGIFYFLSPVVARVYNDVQLIPICRLLCISIITTCWGIVPINLQYKAKRFKRIAIITVLIQLTVGIVACIMAYTGAGVYALVFQSILSSLFISLIYNLQSRLPLTLAIKRESLEKIYSFSLFQFLFNILVYFSRNLDKLLIGKMIGMSQLGYYDKSYRLMMLPLQNITFVITPVILPIFSALDNIKLIGEKYLKLLKPLSYISFPLSVLMFECSEELIFIIFGNQWGPAVAPLKILSLTIGFQIILSTTGGIFQAAGATKHLFYSGCWGAFFIISSLLGAIYIWKTVEAVCYAYLLAQLANVIQCFISLFKVVGQNILIPFQIMFKSIMLSSITFVVLYVFGVAIADSDVWLRLITKTVLWGVLTTLLIQLFTPYNILHMIKGRFKSILS